MNRINGWETKLKLVIDKHLALPSEYGISDCYLIADDAVFAITGERIYTNVNYSNELGAARALRERGFTNVEEAFAAKFEEIHPALAQRGDIGIIVNADGELCGGFFSSLGFVARDKTTLIFLPISSVKSAFKVAR